MWRKYRFAHPQVHLHVHSNYTSFSSWAVFTSTFFSPCVVLFNFVCKLLSGQVLSIKSDCRSNFKELHNLSLHNQHKQDADLSTKVLSVALELVHKSYVCYLLYERSIYAGCKLSTIHFWQFRSWFVELAAWFVWCKNIPRNRVFHKNHDSVEVWAQNKASQRQLSSRCSDYKFEIKTAKQLHCLRSYSGETACWYCYCSKGL